MSNKINSLVARAYANMRPPSLAFLLYKPTPTRPRPHPITTTTIILLSSVLELIQTMAMSYTMALMEPSVDVDKLSYEIFTVLESEFLFGGYSGTTTPSSKPLLPSSGKVRVLSIDAGAGLLPALALSRLETHLRRRSNDPSAHLADFFDIAAGSGAGGVLAAMLFTRGPDGRPLFSADDALRTLSAHRRRIVAKPKKGIFAGMFRRSAAGGGIFGRLFGGATLKDTVKPVLVPCYDATTGAPFVFSRADAVEAEEYDFKVADVCAATCGGGAVEVRSVDGRTRVVAVGGGAAAMMNPAAAAITHVLNNKREFPLADGVEDLLAVSLGGGEGRRGRAALPSAAEFIGIAGEGTADMVDQTVAMAFGHNRTTNYVRIQANDLGSQMAPGGTMDAATAAAAATLSERNVESVLFQGRKISEKTNGEKLEWFADELIKEQERRMRSPVPTVVIKPGMSPPRTSSATTATTSTSTSSTTTTTTTSPFSSSSM